MREDDRLEDEGWVVHRRQVLGRLDEGLELLLPATSQVGDRPDLQGEVAQHGSASTAAMSAAEAPAASSSSSRASCIAVVAMGPC